MKNNRPPVDGPEFEALMREIDAKLSGEGIEIPKRSFRAIWEVSRRYKIAIPTYFGSGLLPADLREGAPIGEAIRNWYSMVYADRLKVDPRPGVAMVVLDGDLYTMSIPRMGGSLRLLTQRTFIPMPMVARGPIDCNLVQLVDGMTEAKAALLSDAALGAIEATARRAFPALHTLESTPHDLMRIARANVESAVDQLVGARGHAGESKWASLQVAEKAMKAAIALEDGTYGRVHALAGLASILEGLGIKLAIGAYEQAIQCKGGIRYGEESCTKGEALAAHAASLDLVNALCDSGAKFARGLDYFGP